MAQQDPLAHKVQPELMAQQDPLAHKVQPEPMVLTEQRELMELTGLME